MAREFAKKFYHSKQWKDCQSAYMHHIGYVCEKCKEKYPNNPELWNVAKIVHHKVHLNPNNIDDPSITLSFDNLCGVCNQCHAEEHPEIYGNNRKRYVVDANGDVRLI